MEPVTAETTESAAAGMSYVLRDEEQLGQIWTDSDRSEYDSSLRESIEQIASIREAFKNLHTQSDLIWERFVTLTLERLLTNGLREFLDRIDGEILGLNQQLVEGDSEVEQLRARIQERRRWLEEKIGILELMAHRTSTQTHLNMMLARVEGLEAYLLGKKDVPPQAYELHYKRKTTLPGDLLYIRVRLSTTQIAVAASTLSKQLSELDSALTALLPEIDRCKTELTALITRIECMSELSRYWLAYLEIAPEKRANSPGDSDQENQQGG